MLVGILDSLPFNLFEEGLIGEELVEEGRIFFFESNSSEINISILCDQIFAFIGSDELCCMIFQFLEQNLSRLDMAF